MATSRDVDEIIEKLSSDRARTRDEGVKLLGTWLQGDRAFSFCRLLARNTANLKPGHIPGSATWPFLVMALTKCVIADISAKKRGAPKSAAARMLRLAVQCAEDFRLSGRSLLLISVVKKLFSHIWEVVKDAPSFLVEYSIILRQLLTVKEYQYQMKPRTYSSFVVLYMKKVATGFDEKFGNQTSSKEESFRCTLTLHVLLENPPGDYPDMMREESLFITYAKVQLKLARAIPKILEKLLDVIVKELDQNFNTGAGLVWCEAPRDEKSVSLRCFQEELIDLSATVLYLVYKCTPRTSNREKRLKTEHVMTIVMDSLPKGSLVWTGSICYLINKYGYRVDKTMLISWFEATCKGLKSVLSNANAVRFQDSLLWIIRVLKEFSALLMFNARDEPSFLLTKGEVSIFEGHWQDTWNSLIHALPLFSTTALVADSVLRLLGEMIMRDQVHASFVSEDTWDLQIFKQLPSSSALYFIACYFSKIGFQGFSLLNERNVLMIPETIFSLCAGFSSPVINSADTSQLFGECKNFSKDEFWFHEEELGYSVEALSEINLENPTKAMSDKCSRAHLPRHIQQPLLLELLEFTKGFVSSNEQFEKVDLPNLLYACSLVCNLIHCSLLSSLSEDLNPDSRSSFVDMDLDMTGSGEVDTVTAGGSGSMGISPRPLERKLELVYIISSFFSVVPIHTWEVLYNLAEKEVDVKDIIGHLLSMLHDTDYRVSSNIGVKMVQFSYENPVKAREVLAIGPQSVPLIETSLITLAHLSLQSEDVEVECVFMISAVAALELSQRELAYALFDSVSKRLNYASRSKYLNQLIGQILFRWFACELSLVSLVEVKEMFGFKSADPKNFIEHCCSWLLPFLILRGDTADLNWLSKILSKPLSDVIKGHFVPIFGLCITARCGSGPEKDLAETVLCESLLQLGEISEPERDDLIKKHMVSIVGFLLSISSSSRQPEIPYFSTETVAHSVKTVVDGFMDAMDDNLAETVVIDKISIFRSDRVFKWGVTYGDNHCKANAAIFYLSCWLLSNQTLLLKLLLHLASSFSNEKEGRGAFADSSRVLSLLRQLTIDADPLLYDYIRALEPLPSFDCLKDIQVFHASLSGSYDSRDQFLKGSSHATRAISVEAGICDVHQVIFHVPNFTGKYPIQLHIPNEDKLCLDYGISDDILVGLLKLLKTCLSDESVEIIDVTSRTLRGILSTARGLNALHCLDSPDRSLLMVHSRGINSQLVEQTLLGMEKISGVSLEDPDLWRTDGRTYKQWLCTLAGSLICHCDDIILRSLAFHKAEAAELLLASALVNIVGNLDSNAGMCRIISTMVEEIIFSDCNHLMKSDGRSVRSKSRSPTATPSSSWKKVYWLSVDYLVAARAANRCSCDFATLMYVELWCEEKFNMLALGPPDFSHEESLPPHIDLLVAAFTRINELDSIYGITLANEITSQIIRYEHEGDWSSALEYHDLLVRSTRKENLGSLTGITLPGPSDMPSKSEEKMPNWQMHKGLMRSLQKTGCSHVLDVYCQGLSNQKSCLQQDSEFIDIQYEAAWRAGNWDFSYFVPYSSQPSTRSRSYCLFNENLHSCLRALQNGDSEEFHVKLSNSKMDLVLALSNASKESTKYIHSTVLKLQMLDHLTMVWDLRWKFYPNQTSKSYVGTKDFSITPTVPTMMQLELLNKEWTSILCQTERSLDLLEPFLAFRSAVLKILGCEEHLREHLFQSASALRKGVRFSLAAAVLYELKELCCHMDHQAMPDSYFSFKLEEAKLLRAQGQHDMAISLGKYILKNHPDKKTISDVYRLVGKWLAETRSSNSRTIIDDYLRHSVDLTGFNTSSDKKYKSRQCRTYFHLAHYTDGLFKSYEERLLSNEWQAALRLRNYKSEKTDYSVKIQELQKQLALDREEAEKIQDDRDKFLSLALQGYQRSLVVGGKYDLQVVFRLVSLWFSLFSREQVVKAMMKTTKEVQTYKFIPLVYQIASRLGSSKDAQGSTNFQNALASLLKKMAIDHPYHTIFQLLALANGDRVKDRQKSRSSFIVDMDKKLAAENLLKDLSSCHGSLIRQMKQMVEIYIKLAELETKKEDTNKRIPLPRELRSICQLELVPVVTATIPVDPNCQYEEGSFPHFNGLADSIMIMNGINAPKVVECIGSDGNRYRQLAKSGNDDLRQDAVMEQFFSLVNMFLQNHRDTSERRLRIRTYKVVPFTPSAGVVEWVNGTVPLAEYLLGSTRSGGAHGRYGTGDWTYHQCRETMTNEKDKRRAFLKVCNNFRPVMHYFFLERFLQPADWFQSRLAYTRSVAASSMVGYIVGLGDRHSMNILIDQETAEVVHIDLGVAFEQGLMLKTPERVPFRLTRDMIDGMGVTGVEGVFRRCCEKTLSVMRANKEALVTIVEVFVHDPLYKWALSPLKALQRQKEADVMDSCLDESQEAYEGNKDAARAILRVKQKLDGYEDGEMRSVQGQVQQLIQDAVDADRLCQMFPGWGAWL
uniref:Serine/threonine-protein kinase ATM n=1 Tax=Leersia perrieri TaxID=77586 RepID=A0A0D9UVU8_9ORYZ